MKRKITLLYVTSIIGLISIILMVQMVIFFYFVFTEGSPKYQQSTPENITIDFANYIYQDNDGFSVTDEGTKILEENQAWFQLIDQSGNVVYDVHAPKDSQQHYTAKDIASLYKYSVDGYTSFISEVKLGDQSWSYLVAFPYDRISRYFVYLNFDNILSFYPYGMIMSIAAVILCIVIFSYGVARYFAKPVLLLIRNITDLVNGVYVQRNTGKGIFKEVFISLNKLSTKLQEVNDDREKVDNMRQEWITNLTHDLKTPLSSIKGYSELLADNTYSFTNDEKKQYAEIIGTKAAYIEKLIGDLKLTYQLKNELLPLQKREVNMIELVRELIITYINNPSYAGKNIDFIGEQPSIILSVDEKLMQRAINNIVINSIVHNPDGTQITVSIIQNRNNINIMIKDNGYGIPPDELELVFNRYFRGSNTKNEDGSGLGLAIAQQIILAHSGHIAVESAKGQGTCFTITLKNIC